MAAGEESLRIAAEVLLRSNHDIPTPNAEIARSFSINTPGSMQAGYVITDSVDGQVLNGKMSNVRRFFCLFVTFDLAFTSLMWLVCIMIDGQSISAAVDKQIYHYNLHTSLFDVVLVALCRFIILLLFYGLLSINHWIIIALSTTATCAFLIVKVFQYQWVNSHQPAFEVLLILTSFVISWGEAWFLDFRVLPQELLARRILVNSPSLDNERAPLIRSYVQGLPSMYTESVGNFYSPLGSPAGSLHERENTERPYPTIRLTQQEERNYKLKAVEILEESWRLLSHPEWKLEKKSKDNDEVHVLSLPNARKMFRLTAVVNVSPRYLLEELYCKVENIPRWNPALLESYKILPINEQIDICYQISAGTTGVKARDFINIRHWALIDGCYMIAYSSIEHPSIPTNEKYVRGENGTGCWVMKPVPDHLDKCEFQWVLNTNLKGWVSPYIVDAALVGVMLEYIKNLRKYIGIQNFS